MSFYHQFLKTLVLSSALSKARFKKATDEDDKQTNTWSVTQSSRKSRWTDTPVARGQVLAGATNTGIGRTGVDSCSRFRPTVGEN